ncbi:MAG TPA: alpha/beta hydrolase [Methanoregulaceae archaeon]|nr:alpha/beta hydrolase [Methanoregulaceae archaeon]
MKTEHHTLADGRPLAYSEFGDPTGITAFHAHGGPSSRIEGRIFDKAAQARGYRFIVTDRPGMGESTYLEGRRLLDYPQDIAELPRY